MSGMTVTAKDIVTIMKAAKATGLRYIHLDTLEMVFDTDFHPNQPDITSHTDAGVTGVTADDRGTDQAPAFSKDDVDEMRENALFELADQLVLDDPAAYEEMQLKLINHGG